MSENNKILSFIFNAIYAIMPAIIVVIAGILTLMAYQADELRSLIRLIVPVGLYLSLISGAYYIRSKKSQVKKFDNGTDEVTISISYMTYFWHDALIFGIPCLIVILAYFIKGEVAVFDIGASAVACGGLYLSQLLYRRK